MQYLMIVYFYFPQVSREIDIIVVKIASVLPLDISVNILNPVIATGDFPANLCALKILKELAHKQGKDLTDNHLDSIMPNIARVGMETCYDAVRRI